MVAEAINVSVISNTVHISDDKEMTRQFYLFPGQPETELMLTVTYNNTGKKLNCGFLRII